MGQQLQSLGEWARPSFEIPRPTAGQRGSRCLNKGMTRHDEVPRVVRAKCEIAARSEKSSSSSRIRLNNHAGQVCVAEMGKIFELPRNFRNEGTDATRNSPPWPGPSGVGELPRHAHSDPGRHP